MNVLLIISVLLVNYCEALFFHTLINPFGNIFGGGVTYQLYTRGNRVNGQALSTGRYQQLSASLNNVDRPTRLLVHGFGESGRSASMRMLKNAYLTQGDYNVIVVDYSRSAGSNYYYARNSVLNIGSQITRFLDFMKVGNGLDYKALTVVGYDLGAHIAGIAGKRTRQGRIYQIIGLDPTASLFSINTSGNRLGSGDAEYVEVFHTNAGRIGFSSAIGDVDFFVGDGRTQSGCTTNQCSHFKAVSIFVKFLTSVDELEVTICESIDNVFEICESDAVEIGGRLPSGVYQVKLTQVEP